MRIVQQSGASEFALRNKSAHVYKRAFAKVEMKRICAAVVLFLASLPATAAYVAVPDEVSLSALPASARFVALQTIPLLKDGKWTELLGEKNAFFSNRQIESVAIGSVFPIYAGGREDAHGLYNYWRGQDGNYGLIGFYYPEGRRPKTVGEFGKILGAYFRIEFDAPDPYAGLDKSVVIDIVMKKITDGLKEGKLAATLPHFAYLETLGVALPESFNFYHTDTLAKVGKKDEARAHANAYLKTYGKKGKYYAQIIEIMSRL